MTKCQNCNAKCVPILDLGRQVICNRFLKSKNALDKERRYPLSIVFCPKCSLVQQAILLPTSLIFNKNFNYLSGASKDAVTHFEYMAKRLSKEFKLKKTDFVMDIGSCDGVFLKPLKQRGIGVIGVEPTPKPAKIANAQGIRTIVKQFEQVPKTVRLPQIKLVTAFNVIAHTSTIHPFLEGVETILSKTPNSVFLSQSQYLPDILEKDSFDTLYHEHNRFYTIKSLQNLFARHNLQIYDAQRIGYYGGSIIVYASIEKRPQTKRLKAIINSERKYTKLSTYKQFGNEVKAKRDKLRKLLESAKKQGKRIVGIGAPMKSSVLLSYCGITPKIIDVLTEVNALKIGTYSPSGIKVVDEKKYFKRNAPDIAMILSWNMSDTIMKSLRKSGYKGKFLIPLPDPKIVG